MSLKLITGPANASKARIVLGGVREAAAAGLSPLLVVPTSVDVERFRRELAADVTLGFDVATFSGLERRMAESATIPERPASALLAEMAAGAVSRRLAGEGRMRALGRSAATGGFAPALVELAGELAARGAGPREFAAIAARWAAADPAREAVAADLASLYGAYEEQLARAGFLDPVAYAVAVDRALRESPERWGGVPVFFYGFDDLTDEQLDAVETLACADGTDVVVSLPYEQGRAVFAGRRRAYERLVALGEEEQLAAEVPEGGSGPELFGIERALLEPDAEPVESAGALGFLRGGDERAELELVASRILELAAGGDGDPVPLDEIAVAVRDVRESGPLVAQVLGDAGIPVALERWVSAADTSTGRSLAGLLRCATGEGSADDLVAWLRAPGLVRSQGNVDRLEAQLRREAITGVGEARAAWEELMPGFPLDALDEVAAAAAQGEAELAAELAQKARRLIRAPWRAEEGEGVAPVFGPERELDVRAAAAIVERLEEISQACRLDERLSPGPDELVRLALGVEVRSGDGGLPGAVRVASPLAIRASRVQVLFLCRMNEGIFPSSGGARSLLGEAARAGLARDGGLDLGSPETTIEEERYLLYAAASRPTRRLVASWHEADGDGAAAVRSPFVADLEATVTPVPAPGERARGQARWNDGESVGPRQARVAQAADGPAPEPPERSLSAGLLLAELQSRSSWSATAIERYHGCPVRWMVESLLDPEGLDPEERPLLRGRIVHKALQAALAGLDGPLDAGNVEAAIARAEQAVEIAEKDEPLAGDPDRRAIGRARIVADVRGFLEAEARIGRRMAPVALEAGFGPSQEMPVADLGDGLVLSGRFDRVDRADGSALVIDYKGRSRQKPWTKWREDGRLQAALYALAWEKLNPQDTVVGALYQQVGNDNGARGFVLDDAPDKGLAKSEDALTREELDELLEEIRQTAAAAVAGMRAGVIEPRPESCTDGGGCAYPAICRCRR